MYLFNLAFLSNQFERDDATHDYNYCLLPQNNYLYWNTLVQWMCSLIYNKPYYETTKQLHLLAAPQVTPTTLIESTLIL